MLFLPNSVVSHIFKVFFNLLSLYLGSFSKFKNMVSLAVLFDIVIWHTGINVFFIYTGFILGFVHSRWTVRAGEAQAIS